MTPDMKFEALLVSPDLRILQGVLKTLEEYSIVVDVCMSPARAVDILTKRNVDLVVIDCDKGSDAAEVAKTVGSSSGRKATIAALVDHPLAGKQVTEAGAHVLIQKPLTCNFRSDFRNLVYSRMTWEWRQQSRYTAVMCLVAATDTNDRPVPITMADISRAGVGFSFAATLLIDDILSFRVMLPGTNRIIHFDARILWTLPDKRAGAEFVKISTADADVLHGWLHSRHRVKKLDSEQEISISECRELSLRTPGDTTLAVF